MTTVMATAASTCIILGALIVQTKYLAAKLDKIQDTVDEISRTCTPRTSFTTWTKPPITSAGSRLRALC